MRLGGGTDIQKELEAELEGVGGGNRSTQSADAKIFRMFVHLLGTSP